jgi:DNA modification methylase
MEILKGSWEAVIIATKGQRKTWNGGNNRSNILEFQKVIPQAGDHPTPKPESLMRQLIEDNSNPEDLTLDPFMGSGTTLRAAKDLGRKAVGIEIEEKYCEIAAKRLSQEVFDFK